MNAKYLAEIKAREQAATPGPWVAESYYPEHISEPVPKFRRVKNSEDNIVSDLSFSFQRSDANFISHARADIPALVAEVERLRGVESELVYEKRANEAITGVNSLINRSVDKIKQLRSKNATLEKALELACTDLASAYASPITEDNVSFYTQRYIQQAQEQEEKQ